MIVAAFKCNELSSYLVYTNFTRSKQDFHIMIFQGSSWNIQRGGGWLCRQATYHTVMNEWKQDENV